jgi:hypothetical protein
MSDTIRIGSADVQVCAGALGKSTLSEELDVEELFSCITILISATELW